MFYIPGKAMFKMPEVIQLLNRILTLNVIHAGFGGEDSLNLPLMDPSLEAYLLQKDEESDEVR